MRTGLAAIALMLMSGFLSAQPAPPPAPQIIRLEVRPAPSPRLARAYPLIVPLRDRTAGNAAIYYHRAMAGLAQRDQKTRAEHVKTLEKPTAELAAGEAVALLAAIRGPLRELETGSRCGECDWGLEQRIDADGMAVLLPEIQGLREAANLLAFKARVEIAEGKIDDALRTIRTGLTMARHVAEGPTLIQALVGLAVGAVFETRLQEMIQRPECPNLFWSLAELPRPFADLHRPLEGELLMIDRVVPDLRELEKGPMTPEQADEAMERIVRKLLPFNDMDPDNVQTKLAVAAWVLAGLPGAKKALVADGLKAEIVDKMPASQVVLLATWGRFRRMRDDVLKWTALPYSEGQSGMREAVKAFKDIAKAESPILRVLALLVPAVEKVTFAWVRTDRRFAALRAVEALRMHAAANGGKWPEKLADVTVVPVPLDPLTGKPFEYEVKDGRAVMTAPPPAGEPAHAGNSVRYELTLKGG